MRWQIGLVGGLVALVAIGAAALYVHMGAAPTCENERAVVRVSRILHDDYHLDSVFMNNVKTVTGGYFSDSRDCSAEIAQIKGGENASTLPWREIRYRIVSQGKSEPPAVTVQLGDNVPLAPPVLSFWERLRANL